MMFSKDIVMRVQDLIGPGIDPPAGIPDDTTDLVDLISLVFTTFFSIAAVAAVVFMVYGGFTIIMAAGDSNKLKKGMDTLTNAVIGLVLVIISGLIFNFIANLLGVKDLISVLDIPVL